MRKYVRMGVFAACVAALAIPAGAFSASADRAQSDEPRAGSHDLESPLSDDKRERRMKAAELQARGKIEKGRKVARIAKRRYVELARESTDKIFVVIAEFGNDRHPSYPDGQSDALVYDGPMHNSIPQPNRRNDNTTLWQPDYDQGHYQDMYFNRMAAYYERQSSGRYSVDGAVTDWVKVPFNEARYGRDVCGSIVCSNTWFLIRDAINIWTQDQLDSGKSMQEVVDYLKSFDEWDRYDYNQDGNFNEPDGYIDHFQIVHAGGDQAAGDPQQGTDAIWSHRWYAFYNLIGAAGPADNPAGGLEFGGGGSSPVEGGGTAPNTDINHTGVWVGDYTIQPENGGLGVFAHEFGHDLGLPDLYDTSGNTGGAENSTGFWSLMSSGANIGDGKKDGIGDDPTDLGAWEKFQLGWLNYEFTPPGESGEYKLGPAEYNTKHTQGLFALLPDKVVDVDLGDPYEGSDYYYSGAGNDLDNVMYTSVTLDDTPSLNAYVRYEIETDWDYGYVVVSTDGGTTWQGVPTNLSTNEDPNGQNFGNGITGSSGGAWVPVSADLSAYANQTVLVGFRYWTDGAAVEQGLQVDGIDLEGNGDPGNWTYAPATGGFRVTTGQETSSYFNAYVIENRQYTSYDRSLKTAYNFGFLDSRPDWVETFPYQDGILISYWDSSYTDNNVGDHPGHGLILPVDAHPTFEHYADGTLVRPRILSFDSTFGPKRTQGITIHKDSQRTRIPPQPGVSVFDDTQTWWHDADEHASTGSHDGRYQPGWVGVDVPKTGTTVTVDEWSPNGAFARIEVEPK